MSDLFYLQDSRSDVGDRLMFWASESRGYTSNLDRTELFTTEDAEWHYRGRETDVPWPKAYIDERTEQACDMQYVKEDDAEAKILGARACLVQLKGRYNGNDMIWVSVDGGHTTNIAIALVMTAQEASNYVSQRRGYMAWAKPYIDARTRRVVTRRHVNLKEALRGTGIKIIRPKAPKKDRVNCVGCGRFLYEAAIYADCPNCGADNCP